MRRLQKFAALFAMAAYLSTAFAHAAQSPQKSRLESWLDIAWGYLTSPAETHAASSVPVKIATADLTKDQYLYLYIHNAKAPKDQQITKLEIYNLRASKEDPRSVFGEIRNQKNYTGVVHLRVHRNAVTMDYASTEEDRPGYGVLLFREKAGGVAGDPRVYVGGSLEHDCECPNDDVRFGGPIHLVQAILSHRPMLDETLKRDFFDNMPRLPVSSYVKFSSEERGGARSN